MPWCQIANKPISELMLTRITVNHHGMSACLSMIVKILSLYNFYLGLNQKSGMSRNKRKDPGVVLFIVDVTSETSQPKSKKGFLLALYARMLNRSASFAMQGKETVSDTFSENRRRNMQLLKRTLSHSMPGPFLLAWTNLNPRMEKSSHIHSLYSMGWDSLFILKLQRLYRWSLGMDTLAVFNNFIIACIYPLCCYSVIMK